MFFTIITIPSITSCVWSLAVQRPCYGHDASRSDLSLVDDLNSSASRHRRSRANPASAFASLSATCERLMLDP